MKDKVMLLLSDFLENHNWPSKLKSLSQPGNDWWNRANLTSQAGLSKFDLLTTGFKEAGDNLAQQVIKRRAAPDVLVYPILFLYRHYLELALKQIIIEGNIFLENDPQFANRHFLNELWLLAKDVLGKIFDDLKMDDLKAVEFQINQFDEMDKNSEAFRYPFNNKMESFNYTIKNINIRILSEIIDGLHAFFFGAAAKIGEYAEHKKNITE